MAYKSSIRKKYNYLLPNAFRYHFSMLEDLLTCTTEVYHKSCGAEAAASIKPLVRAAFSDPAYLRYDRKPDCGLHLNIQQVKVESYRIYAIGGGMKSGSSRVVSVLYCIFTCCSVMSMLLTM